MIKGWLWMPSMPHTLIKIVEQTGHSMNCDTGMLWMSYCNSKQLKANLRRDRDVQSKGNNRYREDQMCRADLRREREQVRKQRGKKYTTPNIYTRTQMYCRMRQRTGGSIHYIALQNKCASKQCRCTRIQSRSTMRQKRCASTNRRCTRIQPQ